jgi:hypothetical protein
MGKKITVSLDGKELTLNVGIGGFYQIYKEATGKDLLTTMQNIDSALLTEFGQGATYAGYFCECRMNKVKPEFTKEQIFDMVFFAEAKYSGELLNKFNEMNKTEETGEQNGQLKESVLTS